jgi:hypothetical protein
MTVPEGAQRSEDGYYWLDGGDWKPVPEDDAKHPAQTGGGTAPAAGAAAAAAGGAAGSGEPLDDEQVKQALTQGYNEVVAYGDTHGAELSTEPDAGAGEHEAGEHEGSESHHEEA